MYDVVVVLGGKYVLDRLKSGSRADAEPPKHISLVE